MKNTTIITSYNQSKKTKKMYPTHFEIHCEKGIIGNFRTRKEAKEYILVNGLV